MILPNLILSLLFFLLAGYYGAVRSILLEYSFNWLTLRQGEESRTHQVFYWRRILRMMRFVAVAIGCFCLTLALLPWLKITLQLNTALSTVILLVTAAVFWISGYTVCLKIGLKNRQLMDLKAFPVRFAEWFLTPVYWLVEPFVKEKFPEGRFFHSVREETDSADDSEPEENSKEEQMFINAIDFKDVRIRDCMIPRTEISAVSVDDSIEELRQEFIQSGHSKIVVYRDSIDEAIGYCHALELFRKPKQIRDIVTTLLIVPESMPASSLMLRFLEERKSLALVVDEFGGTSGLVSVEDIIEKIFGEIQDEYDNTEDWTERKIDENTYLLSARHEVDYLNEKYGWELPEGEYDTLAGLLIHLHEDIPKVDEEIVLEPFHFRVISMEDKRIELVALKITDRSSRSHTPER